MAAIVRASNCIHGERLESLCEGCTRILNAIDPRTDVYDRATGTVVPHRNAQPAMPERPPFALSQGFDMHATVDKVVEDIKVEGARLTEEALKRAAHNADKTYPHGDASPIGSKHDAEKAPFHLLPQAAARRCKAYARLLRTKTPSATEAKAFDARARYFAAAQRHLTAWWAGEANDPETGLSHLSHLLCCALFLRAGSRLTRPKELTTHLQKGSRAEREVAQQARPGGGRLEPACRLARTPRQRGDTAHRGASTSRRHDLMTTAKRRLPSAPRSSAARPGSLESACLPSRRALRGRRRACRRASRGQACPDDVDAAELRHARRSAPVARGERLLARSCLPWPDVLYFAHDVAVLPRCRPACARPGRRGARRKAPRGASVRVLIVADFLSSVARGILP